MALIVKMYAFTGLCPVQVMNCKLTFHLSHYIFYDIGSDNSFVSKPKSCSHNQNQIDFSLRHTLTAYDHAIV